jgi:hypothetical protein
MGTIKFKVTYVTRVIFLVARIDLDDLANSKSPSNGGCYLKSSSALNRCQKTSITHLENDSSRFHTTAFISHYRIYLCKKEDQETSIVI